VGVVESTLTLAESETVILPRPKNLQLLKNVKANKFTSIEPSKTFTNIAFFSGSGFV
jgi:hypothetical protein